MKTNETPQAITARRNLARGVCESVERCSPWAARRRATWVTSAAGWALLLFAAVVVVGVTAASAKRAESAPRVERMP